MAQIFILLITFYQKAISPLLPKTCRYEPTCSSYAISAIKKHGALAGLYLGVKRILRCTPWSKHQHFDPAPDEFTWRKKDHRSD